MQTLDDKIKTLDAQLAVLDALIAHTHAQIVQPTKPDTYKLDARPLAFAYPVSHTERWGELADSIVFGSSMAPADARWSGPSARRTLRTGPVDASVAFAVAVGFGGDL